MGSLGGCLGIPGGYLWGPLGSLGVSGSALGILGGPWEVPWGFPGVPWGCLGVSGGPCGDPKVDLRSILAVIYDVF